MSVGEHGELHQQYDSSGISLYIQSVLYCRSSSKPLSDYHLMSVDCKRSFVIGCCCCKMMRLMYDYKDDLILSAVAVCTLLMANDVSVPLKIKLEVKG